MDCANAREDVFPKEFEASATAKGGQITKKISLIGSQYQRQQSATPGQPLREKTAPKKKKTCASELLKKSSRDAFSGKVIQNIFCFADEFEKKYPESAYCDGRTIEAAYGTPELMHNQLRLEQTLAGRGLVLSKLLSDFFKR